MKKLILSVLSIALLSIATNAQSDQKITIVRFVDGSAAYVKTVDSRIPGAGLLSYSFGGIVGTELQMSINLNTPPEEEGGFKVIGISPDPDNKGHVCVDCASGGPGCCNCDAIQRLTDIQNAVTLRNGNVIYSNFAGFTTDINGNITGVMGKGDISTSTGEIPSCVEISGGEYRISSIEEVNREAVIMNTPTNHNDLGWELCW